MPEDVGKAIVDYLRNGRPLTDKRHVFVCHLHRIGEPLSSSAIGAIVRRRFGRAGMNVPSTGAHIFRQYAVRRMLKWYEEGANLDCKILALSTYLGHAQITDTYWYLSAVPELLTVASERFENFANKERRRDIL